MAAFVIVENLETGREAQEFVGRQTKLPALRVLVVKVVVDGKCFIGQEAAWFERLDERGEQRPIEVEEDDDDIVDLFPKAWVIGRWLFEVDLPSRDIGERTGPCCLRELTQSFGVAVDGVDTIAV